MISCHSNNGFHTMGLGEDFKGKKMAKSTKIEKLETFLWDRWLLLKIHCEDGTVGIGEGGVHGWQRPTKTMIETMEPYLLGKDPHKIEHHYQWLYRSSHFMGSVVQGALSAIDIALWDIKGKRLGVPIYDLMGGKTRDKVRCYMHVSSGENGSAAICPRAHRELRAPGDCRSR